MTVLPTREVEKVWGRDRLPAPFAARHDRPAKDHRTALAQPAVGDEAAIAALDKAAPLFVVHKPNDKYLTPQGAELLKAVQARSPAPQRLGSFELYRYPAPE